jgi:hypothetical protein
MGGSAVAGVAATAPAALAEAPIVKPPAALIKTIASVPDIVPASAKATAAAVVMVAIIICGRFAVRLGTSSS